MEMYLMALPFVTVIFVAFVAILAFGLMQHSTNRIVRRMNRRTAEEARKRQEEIWQRLFAKADNTERLTQEILTRLAPRDSVH